MTVGAMLEAAGGPETLAAAEWGAMARAAIRDAARRPPGGAEPAFLETFRRNLAEEFARQYAREAWRAAVRELAITELGLARDVGAA